MKKIIMIIMLSILAAGASCADVGLSDADYKTLDQTRVKLVRMRQEMDKFIRDLAGPYMDQGKSGAGMFGQDVRVDVTENDKEVIVKADLPGMSKDKIEILLEKNRILKISGSREIVTNKTAPGLVRQERMTGNFERVLELPADCEGQGIKATYNEGVLEIVLAKKKISKEEAVKIKIQ